MVRPSHRISKSDEHENNWTNYPQLPFLHCKISYFEVTVTLRCNCETGFRSGHIGQIPEDGK